MVVPSGLTADVLLVMVASRSVACGICRGDIGVRHMNRSYEVFR
jgi:hypothetical protein